MYKEKTVLKVCQKNKIFIYMSDLINYYLFFRNSHFRFSTLFHLVLPYDIIKNVQQTINQTNNFFFSIHVLEREFRKK